MTRYTHTGQEVLRDGKHYADAVTPEAAAEICAALNISIIELDPSAPHPVRIRGCLGVPQRQGDEYACSCGKRWDVSEGEEHP